MVKHALCRRFKLAKSGESHGGAGNRRARNLLQTLQRGGSVEIKRALSCVGVESDRHIVAQLDELMSPDCCRVARIGKSLGPLHPKRLRKVPAPGQAPLGELDTKVAAQVLGPAVERLRAMYRPRAALWQESFSPLLSG